MGSTELTAVIAANAAEVVTLHTRMHEAARCRSDSATARDAWKAACATFHARYDELAFPRGYAGAAARIAAGDAPSIEAALCFLELRPYFFRSGYMRQRLLRKVKRAPLSPAQGARLRVLLQREALWRDSKVRSHAV